MTVEKYDGSSFVPAPLRHYDDSFDMPWWRGASVYKDGGSRWVDRFLDEGLELHYDWTEQAVSSGSVLDRSGNDNDGAINNSAEVYNKQAVGRELEFDASDDEVRVPHDPSLDIQTGDFTIFVRARLGSGGTHTLLQKKGRDGSGASDSGYNLITSSSGFLNASYSGQVQFFYGDGSNIRAFAPDAQLPNGGLFDICIRFRSSDNTVFVDLDGQSVGSTSFGSAPVDNDDPLTIGARYNGSGDQTNVWDGAIGEIRFYSRMLSDAEVSVLSEQARSRKETWRFKRDGQPFEEDHAFDFIHDPNKSNPYQLAIIDVSTDNVDHYETSTIDGSWTKVSDDIMSRADASVIEPQTIIIDNGTYYVFDSTDDSYTGLWTGSGLSSLTDQGQVLDSPDSGAFYDGSTWYLYVEAGDASGVSNERLDIYTASSPDGSYSLEGTAIDFTDRYNQRGEGVGDPDVYELDGVYWMFFDVTSGHPEYSTAVARSIDLLNWEFVEDSTKTHRGGDLKLLDDGTNRWAYCEYGDTARGHKGTARFDVTKIT